MSEEINKPYKEVEKKSNKNTSHTDKKGIVVDCDHLRIRKEASLESDILGLLNKNDEVKITGSEKNFYKVLIKNIKGYCLKKFIKIVSEETSK